MNRPAIIVISPGDIELAGRVARAIDGSVEALAARLPDAEVKFDDLRTHLSARFAAGIPIVAILASGALIRLLAPVLTDKTTEPPVIAVSGDGKFVVPLLGGHHGANDLARRIAAAIDGHAAITTAGDTRYGVALDDPPPGWRLANPESAKEVMASLLAGAKVNQEGLPHWLAGSALPMAADGAVRLSVTATARNPQPMELVYRPATLVLGIGCERGASQQEAVALAEQVMGESGLSPQSLACVASIDLKTDEPAVHAVAGHFGVPARFFDAATLEAEAPRLQNPSDLVFAETGCHGVAEGAALAGVGRAGELVVAKSKSKRVTAALARSPSPLIGVARPGTRKIVRRRHRARHGGLALAGNNRNADAGERLGRLFAVSRFGRRSFGRQDAPRLSASATRRSASAAPWNWRGRGVTWRSSARAMPEFMPWQRLSSNCSIRRV